MPILKKTKTLSQAVKEKKQKKTFDKSGLTEIGKEKGFELLKTLCGETISGYVPALVSMVPQVDEAGNPVLDEDGDPLVESVFDIEEASIHTCKGTSPKGKFYTTKIRCTQGIKYTDEDTGEVLLDGECPACTNLYNVEREIVTLKVKRQCLANGWNMEDRSNPAIKDAFKAAYDERVIGSAVLRYAVPFIVPETERIVGKNGKKISIPLLQKDESGNVVPNPNPKWPGIPVFTPMFKILSGEKYKNLRAQCAVVTDEMQNHPAGLKITFKFPAGDNSKPKDKMNAERNMIPTCSADPREKLQVLAPEYVWVYDYLDEWASENMTSDDARIILEEFAIPTKKESEQKMAELLKPRLSVLAMLKEEEARAEQSESDMEESLDELGLEIEED